MKLDIGCGQNKKEGFTGLDKFEAPGVDIVHDALVYPWPIADCDVEEAHSSHFFEHIPGLERGKFMDELWRVMAPEAKCTIIVPYGKSNRAYQDYTHQWPPVIEDSFYYFNRGWREANKLTHGLYDLKCNFDFTGGHSFYPDWATRNIEAQQFGVKHYLNVATDMIITLTKKL